MGRRLNRSSFGRFWEPVRVWGGGQRLPRGLDQSQPCITDTTLEVTGQHLQWTLPRGSVRDGFGGMLRNASRLSSNLALFYCAS
jgi:hypothetical protein